jgi:uncharacterized protein YjbI with pentapeptide repeats
VCVAVVIPYHPNQEAVTTCGHRFFHTKRIGGYELNKSEPIRSLESIDLSSCTILDKNFSGVKFNGASFRGTRFDNVGFSGATFTDCDFTECRMTDCQLDHAQAHMTDFSLVIFENCSVANMQMRECQMEAVSPYSTELSDIDMDDATQSTRTDQEQDVDDILKSLQGGMC